MLWLAMTATLMIPAPARPVRCTGYTGAEDPEYRDHQGRFLNCQGKPLDESQCAADFRYWPLGSVLVFSDQVGHSFIRVVADCGRLIRGRDHIDLCWKTRRRMKVAGTRFYEVRRIKVGSSANWRVTRFRGQSSKVSHDGHAGSQRLDRRGLGR